MSDSVNHPSHYKQGKLEMIEAVEGLNLGFHAGNALKYLVRYQYKHDTPEGRLEDLRKARWYINRLITIAETSGNLRSGDQNPII
tara:strand:+ start:639 stop:893 length:255 start_codon:yes stop_codon:yes gene_type:complete